MAQRFNISIPDSLAKRLEPYRKQINLTKIFQEALSKQLESYETAEREVESMNEIIERLKREKAMSIGNLFEQGEKEGEHFVKTASYDDLDFAVNCYCQSYRPWEDKEMTQLNNYFDTLLDKRGNPLLSNLEESQYEDWIGGWIHSVSTLGAQLLAKV